MLAKLPASVALAALLGLSCLVLLFHLSIIVGLLPYELTWGGKLESREQMLVFESISIAVNLFIILVLLMRAGVIRIFSQRVVRLVLWMFVIVFAMNTLGNLFAQSMVEKILGGSLTFISSLLFYRLLMPEPDSGANAAEPAADKAEPESPHE